MKILSDNKDLPWVKNLSRSRYAGFLQLSCCLLQNYKRVPVHFIGSIAHHFEENLRATGDSMGITVGTITVSPNFRFANYHMKNHFKEISKGIVISMKNTRRKGSTFNESAGNYLKHQVAGQENPYRYRECLVKSCLR